MIINYKIWILRVCSTSYIWSDHLFNWSSILCKCCSQL